MTRLHINLRGLHLTGQLVVPGLSVLGVAQRLPHRRLLGFGRVALDAQCRGGLRHLLIVIAHLPGKCLRLGRPLAPPVKEGQEFLPLLQQRQPGLRRDPRRQLD